MRMGGGLQQWFPKWAVPPLRGGGITEVGANRYERRKGALLLSQGALVDK